MENNQSIKTVEFHRREIEHSLALGALETLTNHCAQQAVQIETLRAEIAALKKPAKVKR